MESRLTSSNQNPPTSFEVGGFPLFHHPSGTIPRQGHALRFSFSFLETVMPISISGKLRIKRINGSNGPFCVGDLETEIGEFRVKDAVLDQFDEGIYDGQFWIQQIYPWSYTTSGRTVIEIRAKLADLQIKGHQRIGTPTQEPGEPDPAKEAPGVPPPMPPEPKLAQEAQARDESSASHQISGAEAIVAGDSDDPDFALFGPELYGCVKGEQAVKLDPAIDRIQFRMQRDRLKALGYSFQTHSQSWHLNA
jgi:hypothetical protein